MFTYNWVKKKISNYFGDPPVTLDPERKNYFDDKTRLDVNQGDYVRMLQTMKSQMDNPMHCEAILDIIPHYNNTSEHWFKGVMSAFFASEKTRSMMIYKSKFWKANDIDDIKKKNKKGADDLQIFYEAVRTILFNFNRGNRENVEKAFEQINPQAVKMLLTKMGNTSSGDTLSQQMYVKTFCVLLSIRCVFMVSVKGFDRDRLYVNPLAQYDKYDDLSNILNNTDMLREDGGVDMVWVTNLEDIQYKDRQSIIQFIKTIEDGHPKYTAFTVTDFEKSSPGMELFDETYLKDVVFPTSLDKSDGIYKSLSEDMIGITCNGRRYIYNIWISFLPKLNEQQGVVDNEKRPPECILLPYDWITRPNISFQMDKNKCKIAKYERKGMSLNTKYDVDKTLGYRMFVCINKKYDMKPSKIVEMMLQDKASSIEDVSDKQAIVTKDSTKEIDASIVLPPKEVGIQEENINNKYANVKLEDPRTLLCIRRVDNFSKLDPMYKFTQSTWNPEQFLKDLPTTSPKLKMLLDNIAALDEKDLKEHKKKYKHFIFSDLNYGYGTSIIASGLIASKRHLIFGKGKDWFMRDNDRLNDFQRTNGFGILTKGAMFTKNPMSETLRNQIKNAFNERPNNIHGENVQILLVDKDFKEGIDLYDVKYVHIFEPQEFKSSTKQVIGRSTRKCGQAGLKFIPRVGWPLNVFVYNTLISKNLEKIVNTDTLFNLYINNQGFNLKERVFVSDLEKICMEGAVDHDLNSSLHSDDMFETEGGNQKGKGNNEDEEIEQEKEKEKEKIPFKDLFKPFLAIRRLNVLSKMHRILRKTGNWIENDAPYNYLLKLKTTSPLYNHLLDTYNENKEEFIKTHHEQIKKNLKTTFRFLSKTYPQGFYDLHGGNNQPKLKLSDSFSSIPEKIDDKENENENENGDKLENKEPSAPPLIDEKEKEERKSDEKEKEDKPNTFLEFKDYVKNKFSDPKYSWNNIEIQNDCLKKTTQLPEFTPTQNFISNYFNPSLTTVKGMLLWHGVGTGKTCTAISTATQSFVPYGYDILWVTRSSLKDDIKKNMYEVICNIQMREHVKKTGSVPSDNSARKEIIGPSWRLESMSHSQFTNMLSGKNKGFLQRLFGKEEEEEKENDDPLRKTLVIVDEAHRLYKPGKETHHAEIADMKAFNAAVQNSYKKSGNDSVRLLLMTATPIVDDPMDLIKLLNLFKFEKNQLPERFDQFERAYMDDLDGKFTKNGRDAFLNDIAGLISYLNQSKDPRQFAQPNITQLYAPMSTTNQLEVQEKLDNLGQRYGTLYEELKTFDTMMAETKAKMSQAVKYLGEDPTSYKENLMGIEASKQDITKQLKTIQREINAIKKNPIDKNDKSQEAVILNQCFKNEKINYSDENV